MILWEGFFEGHPLKRPFFSEDCQVGQKPCLISQASSRKDYSQFDRNATVVSPSPLQSADGSSAEAKPPLPPVRRMRVSSRMVAARAMLRSIVPYATDLRRTNGTGISRRCLRLLLRVRHRFHTLLHALRHIPATLAASAPTSRFVRHAVLLLLVVTVTLSERLANVSLQMQSPWAEHAVVLFGGSNAVPLLDDSAGGELVERQLPVQATSGPLAARTTEPAAPPSRAPRAVNDAYRTLYTLRADETLGEVAARYQVSVAALIWANGLESGAVLALGQELRIPRLAGLPYVVREGDTLETIAALLQVDPAAIVRFAPNNVSFAAPLPVGRELFVPIATLSVPAPLLERFGGEAGLAARLPRPAAAILATQTNIRRGPGRVYDKVAQLDTGQLVELIGRYESWLKVQLPDAVGWIKADLVAPLVINLDDVPVTEDCPPPPPIWVWPTRGSISSGFGSRWGGFHNGLDIANSAWTPIVAARAGQVVEAGWCSGYGYCVRISHGGGVETIYGHMITRPAVGVGDEVAVGQLIGKMGSTYDRAGGGYSTGVHLHFTVLVNGRAVNPLKFLP